MFLRRSIVGFPFFFEPFDIFLGGEFQGLSNEFTSAEQGDGFASLEAFSVGSVFSGGGQFVELSGGLFEEQCFGGGFVVIFEEGHGNSWGEGCSENCQLDIFYAVAPAGFATPASFGGMNSPRLIHEFHKRLVC